MIKKIAHAPQCAHQGGSNILMNFYLISSLTNYAEH